MTNCKQCKASFEVVENDLKFYKEFDLSAPDICPLCRHQQRCSWRNERELYHRKCDLSGKQIISIYSSDKPFPVYSQEEYWGDGWDALDYGMEVDLEKPFFPQFAELMDKVPRLAIVNKQTENSEYSNYSFANRNCYLTFGNHYEEDCMYGHYSTKNKNCADYLCLYGSELCYECIYSKNCTRSVFLDHCENVSESYFSVDLKNCKNCIFSSNLRNKQYYILNRPHSKEEYFKKLESFAFGGHERFMDAKKFFMTDFRKSFSFRDVYQTNCEYCEGGTHENCKNLRYSFDCTKCEDCAYGFQMDETYNSLDNTCSGYDRLDFCTQTIGINGGNNLIACDSCWHNSDLRYCSLCFNSKNLFGCISMKRNEYCILNRQYSKAEYEALVPRLIENMKRHGEWGRFFPTSISPFGYNETIAYYSRPFSQQDVLARGWKWHQEVGESSYKGPLYRISDKIQDVPDEITKRILICETSGKPYKVIPQELKFYRQLGVPVPRRSPLQRHMDRLALRNPYQLFDRNCAKCSTPIKTSYSPERPEQVYCDACYLKTVY
jgi:hypothetical protein